MAERVVRFWLSAKDPERLGRFYEGLFDWRVRTGGLTSVEAGVTGRLHLLDTGGEIPGLIALEPERRGAALMVEVDDLESALERARRMGASLAWRETFELAEAGDLDGRFELAAIVDPEGNRVELLAVASA